MSKDYERKVQTSETLIQVAVIRLLLARLEQHRRTSSHTPITHDMRNEFAPL